MATYNINKIQLPNGDICNTSTEIIKLSNQENNSGISGPFPWNMPAGGAAGQVLKKSSSTDYDVEWANETGGASTIPTKTSDLTNDSGFITDNVSGDFSVTGAANLYGGIGSFEINCGLLAVEQGATIPANSQSVSITANVPNGYTFLCWIGVSSKGWAGLTYPAHYHYSGATIWTNTTSTSAREVIACFLCYKSSMPS